MSKDELNQVPIRIPFGFTALPVQPHLSHDAIMAVCIRNQFWRVFVHCGPSAPLPHKQHCCVNEEM